MKSVLIAALLGAACNEPTVCTAGQAALPRAVPNDTIIHPGQSFTLVYQHGNPCSPDNPWTTVPNHWTTPDTSIVSLDTSTGRVTGRTIGDAHVSPTTGNLELTATIHVR